MDIEKLKKHGYKGVDNPFAAFMWMINEKNIYPDIYFSRYNCKWHMSNRWINLKTGKLGDWDHTNKPFDSYKSAVFHVVDVMTKLM